MPLADGCCVLGAEHLQEPLHGASVDVGHLHAAVPKGQDALLPRRELHHCGDRGCQASPAVPVRGHQAPHSPRGGTDGPLGCMSLPSAAEPAAPARSSVSWHTISSTCASRSSRSRAYISWHRRGPKVPSFCKAQPNQGPQGQSSPPALQPPHCGKTPLKGGPTAQLPRTSPATVPRPRPHQQQAVAVVEVKHQGLIQELVARAHGVGAGLGAAAHAGVICPHLAGAGSPAAAPGSASPPVSQGETEALGQHSKPGPGPSPLTGATLGRVSVGPTVSPQQGWAKEQVPGAQGMGPPWRDAGCHCATRRARSCCFWTWTCPEL